MLYRFSKCPTAPSSPLGSSHLADVVAFSCVIDWFVQHFVVCLFVCLLCLRSSPSPGAAVFVFCVRVLRPCHLPTLVDCPIVAYGFNQSIMQLPVHCYCIILEWRWPERQKLKLIVVPRLGIRLEGLSNLRRFSILNFAVGTLFKTRKIHYIRLIAMPWDKDNSVYRHKVEI